MNRDRTTVERDFWQKLKATARKIPFIDDLVAVYYCALDPRTPLQSKAVLLQGARLFHHAVRCVRGFHAATRLRRRRGRALCNPRRRAAH